MSQLFDNPTVLRFPTWYGAVDELPRPLAPAAYTVQETESDRWKVTVINTGEFIYRSIGRWRWWTRMCRSNPMTAYKLSTQSPAAAATNP